MRPEIKLLTQINNFFRNQNEDLLVSGEEVYFDDNHYSYIQLTDKDNLFKKNGIHYEILYIGDSTQEEEFLHKKGKLYVEIHFESPTYSPYFKQFVEHMGNTVDFTTFPWKTYCPGLRLEDNGYTTKQKRKIINNLQKLIRLTFNDLYNYCFINAISSKWKSKFKLTPNNGKNTSLHRQLPEYYKEAEEIIITHELIKVKLINEIRNNVYFLGNDAIDLSSISSENPVNHINYIDLVVKTNGKKIYFFEIKTAPDARLCIRQAIGQLLEYSYYPNVSHADRLYVVGSGKKTTEVNQYIDTLNKKFSIKIDYIQINNYL